jgi:hypothetical protein
MARGRWENRDVENPLLASRQILSAGFLLVQKWIFWRVDLYDGERDYTSKRSFVGPPGS